MYDTKSLVRPIVKNDYSLVGGVKTDQIRYNRSNL